MAAGRSLAGCGGGRTPYPLRPDAPTGQRGAARRSPATSALTLCPADATGHLFRAPRRHSDKRAAAASDLHVRPCLTAGCGPAGARCCSITTGGTGREAETGLITGLGSQRAVRAGCELALSAGGGSRGLVSLCPFGGSARDSRLRSAGPLTTPDSVRRVRSRLPALLGQPLGF